MAKSKKVLPQLACIGIDLGKTGGIAVLSTTDGLMDLCDMPQTEEEIVELLYGTVEDLKESGYRNITIAMEQTSSRPGEGVVSVRTFALNCGGIYYTALFLAMLNPGITVSRIPPALWKKHFGLISPKATAYQKKKDSVDFVNRKFNMSLRYNKNGLADALLIAHYILEESKGEPCPTQR